MRDDLAAEGLRSGGFGPILVADLRSLTELRRAFCTWLRRRHVRHGRAEELAVVLSELGTNALGFRHRREDPVIVRAEIDTDCDDGDRDAVVWLRVANRRGAHAAATRWDLDDPLRVRGRGMLIVSALTDTLRTEVDQDHTVVTASVAVALDGR